MVRPDWVVTTCGNQKMPGAARAEVFYRGPFVRGQGEVARALRPTRGRLILSNKYGLMAPDFMIPGPYDAHWGSDIDIAPEALAQQVRAHGFRPGEIVLSLGGKDYVDVLNKYLPAGMILLWAPKTLKDKRIGYQGQLHKRLIARGSIPDSWLSAARIR